MPMLIGTGAGLYRALSAFHPVILHTPHQSELSHFESYGENKINKEKGKRIKGGERKSDASCLLARPTHSRTFRE